MIRFLAPAILALATSLPAHAAPGSEIEGTWTLAHRKPGIVEVETVQLLVVQEEGLNVRAEVSIPGVVVKFTGTFDPATGASAPVQGRAFVGGKTFTVDRELVTKIW